MADFSKLSEEISDLLEGVFEAKIDEKEEEISDVSTDRREQILSMVDVSNMNQEEYNVFMDYGIANAINIFHKSTGKVPERSTVLEVVSNALSMAIVTYNIDIAKEAKAAFRTHYGWKVRQVVTDYFREMDKSRKNSATKMNADGEYDTLDNAVQTDAYGVKNSDGAEVYDRPDWEDSDKVGFERLKKLEWCMRQVRHELPRESNLVLDVDIGEVTDFEGKKISLATFAKLTDQPYQNLLKIKQRALILIRQKMERKGYISILLDDEKTTEDLHKETNIIEAIRSFEESEDIMMLACLF